MPSARPAIDEERLTRTLGALAEPTRRAMLARLSRGGATAGELAEPFSIGLPTVSKHLRVLEDAGLVSRERRAQWHLFELRGEPLAELAEWLHTYEAFWAGTLDSLQAYVDTLAGPDAKRGSTRAPSRSRRGQRR